MKHEILVGDVLAGLRAMPDASVQCVVTSPPYSRAVEAGGEAWGLRDYGVEGQIGLEPTPGEYVEKMIEVFREVKRVLRDDGTLWLNLGDSYASAWACGRRNVVGNGSMENGKRDSRPNRVSGDIKEKDMVGIPWRVAFALQADGWYLRSDIIWSKPNSMPESVTDRPTKSHEYVFLFAKSKKYYYDADAVREEHESLKDLQRRKTLDNKGDYSGVRKDLGRSRTEYYNPAGRNRRTVWEIPTQPTPEAHFATFPEALVEPCIKAGTSERGCCPICGAPWRRVTERNRMNRTELPKDDPRHRPNQYKGAYENINGKGDAGYTEITTIGWEPSCTCGGDPAPCVVLDPFGGSGTVAKVARDLGRSSVLIELNPEYVAIMKKKLRVGEQLDTGVCEYVVREVRA